MYGAHIHTQNLVLWIDIVHNYILHNFKLAMTSMRSRSRCAYVLGHFCACVCILSAWFCLYACFDRESNKMHVDVTGNLE